MGKVVGHILTKDFYDYADRMLEGLCKSLITFSTLSHNCDTLLSSADKQKNVTHLANYNHAPDETDDGTNPFENMHDDLIKCLDNINYYLCYLLKIHNFMPQLVAHFGPEYRYSVTHSYGVAAPVPKYDEKRNIIRFDFSGAVHASANPLRHDNFSATVTLANYKTQEAVKNNISTMTNAVFDLLGKIRSHFPNDIKAFRLHDPYRDDYCRLFLENKEIQFSDMPSRMEYTFFTRSDIPLGIFQTAPQVDKWMAIKRRETHYSESIFDSLKKERMSIIFPGIALRDINTPFPISDIKRQFARDLFGIIPAGGLYIGDVQQKPERNLLGPRLAYQRQG
jgi:hypothetical protein